MFAQVKIDCYYRVTTDSILGYIAIEMKKALKPLIHNDFKTFSFGDPSEIRTPDTLIKSQIDSSAAIELEFSGLISLSLRPTDEKYTCEILEASLEEKDGYFIWKDDIDLSEESDQCGTVICSERLSWREIKSVYGSDEFYLPAE